MQNRAIEGDEVALQILPPCKWFITGSMLEKGKAKAGPELDSPVSASPSDASPMAGSAVCSSPGLEASPLGIANSPTPQRCCVCKAEGLVCTHQQQCCDQSHASL